MRPMPRTLGILPPRSSLGCFRVALFSALSPTTSSQRSTLRLAPLRSSLHELPVTPFWQSSRSRNLRRGNDGHHSFPR